MTTSTFATTDEQIRELRRLRDDIDLALERANLPVGHVSMRAWGRARCSELHARLAPTVCVERAAAFTADPIDLPRLTDDELSNAQSIIAARGDCSGPETTFDGLSNAKVGIMCRDNWADVIRWLAECERVFPAALAELRARRAADLTREERAALRKFLIGGGQ